MFLGGWNNSRNKQLYMENNENLIKGLSSLKKLASKKRQVKNGVKKTNQVKFKRIMETILNVFKC